MNVKQRILALRVLAKQEKNQDFLKKLGIEVKIISKEGNECLFLQQRYNEHNNH